MGDGMVSHVKMSDDLGGGNSTYFLFSPRNLGKIPILTNRFQMGWNHQLVISDDPGVATNAHQSKAGPDIKMPQICPDWWI